MAEEQKKAGAPSQKKVAVKKGAPAQVTTQAVKKGEELTRIEKIKKWFREMKAELKKVVWPNKSTVIKQSHQRIGADEEADPHGEHQKHHIELLARGLCLGNEVRQ